MSNTVLYVESDLKAVQTKEEVVLPERFEFDHRSQEMLLVLNEVFDSITSSSKS